MATKRGKRIYGKTRHNWLDYTSIDIDNMFERLKKIEKNKRRFK